MFRFKNCVWLPAVAAALLLSGGLEGASVATAPMLRVPGFAPVGDGAVSKIVRDESGVTVTVHTNGLEPGAYTMWLLIWNNPENCAVPDNCEPPTPDVPDTVAFGASAVVGPSGEVNLGTLRSVGDTSGIIAGSVQAGVTNPLGAEVHAVLAYHGEVVPDILTEQLSTPSANCGGPCPVVQGVPHRPGGGDVMMRLDEIKELLDRVAARNGLRP